MGQYRALLPAHLVSRLPVQLHHLLGLRVDQLGCFASLAFATPLCHCLASAFALNRQMANELGLGRLGLAAMLRVESCRVAAQRLLPLLLQ